MSAWSLPSFMTGMPIVAESAELYRPATIAAGMKKKIEPVEGSSGDIGTGSGAYSLSITIPFELLGEFFAAAVEAVDHVLIPLGLKQRYDFPCR